MVKHRCPFCGNESEIPFDPELAERLDRIEIALAREEEISPEPEQEEEQKTDEGQLEQALAEAIEIEEKEEETGGGPEGGKEEPILINVKPEPTAEEKREGQHARSHFARGRNRAAFHQAPSE